MLTTGTDFVVEESKWDNEKTEEILRKIGEILPHGSGINSDWNITMANRTRVRCQNAFHCMDENGMYDGWAEFVLLFDLKDADYFRLMFIGPESYNKNRKYELRDYLEELFCETLYMNFEGADISSLF